MDMNFKLLCFLAANQGGMAAAEFDSASERIEMESDYHGNPGVTIITNDTQAEYSETYVDNRTAQQFDSRGHAKAAS